MIEPNQLLQTYIRQYQAASKKKRKTSSRPRDLSERTNRLFKTLKRTKPTQVTSLSLEEWHRQIKNLAYFAYRSHNDAVTKLIETSLLPQLIRLDEAMFLPAQRDDISVDFLKQNWMVSSARRHFWSFTRSISATSSSIKLWISSHPAQSWNFRRLWR